MSHPQALKFNNRNSAFYTILKSRVDGYFRDNQLSKKGNLTMYTKAVFMFLLYFLAYTLLVTHTFNSKGVWLLLCVVMGFAMSGIGLCVMHDVNHGGFSKRLIINCFKIY